MLRAAYGLLRESGRVFLEAAPARSRPRDDRPGARRREPGVVEVHDLHVWEISAGFPLLTAHVLVAPGSDCHAARQRLADVLAERFGIVHTTLQVDHAHPPELLSIELPSGGARGAAGDG